jgi:NAD(P)-dependent dehydrogenase (short-subunit alcohol dehydrogenase family)
MADPETRRPLVVITGASQGIGAALAALFAGEVPCRLALLARNRSRLDGVVETCRQAGAEAEAFVCDVADAGAVESVAGRIFDRFGAPEVLVNNAGRFIGAPFLETMIEQFDDLLAANLRSVFLVSKAFLPAMVAAGRGHVFNMSSIAGRDPYPGGTAYCASKFGVTGLSRVMRREMMPHGIRVTTVYPGATFTPSWDGSGVGPEVMMPAEDVARSFLDAWRMSARTVVEEIVLRPIGGDL